MATIYFLGAGASAADGLPTTRGLNNAVASWLLSANKLGAGSHLRSYYKDLYGIRDQDMRAASLGWAHHLAGNRDTAPPDRFSTLPDLVETLSLLDACIAEEQSLGPSSLARGRARQDMNPDFLREVRRQLLFALGTAVQRASLRARASHTQRLTSSIERDDTIITTNWDILVDRCYVATWRKRSAKGWLTASPIRYHCVGEQPVNWRGQNIRLAAKPRSVLRLHGGINWFGCVSCGTVYVNLEGSYIMDPKHRRVDYDDCRCGAGLLTVLVPPSYIKDYRAASLRSVWHEAQRKLDEARRWVFIGYSLPSDDFHVRAMLMRAVRSQAWRRQPARVEVFLGEDGAEAKKRYEDFFRLNPLDVKLSGFAGWVKEHALR
jgi:NAD-dependent SIR2 family protein deacetylase